MRYALRLSTLGLALAAWPAYAQSPDTSLLRTSFLDHESQVASVFAGGSLGRTPSAQEPFRFHTDWFGRPCFVVYGHVSDERWTVGPRMGFMDVGARRAWDGEWSYMGWCPCDQWWAWVAWDVVTSTARPRPTTIDPGPIVPPPVTPVAPVRPRSVPPQRSERRTGSRGWSVLGSVLDGLSRAVLSDLGQALLPDLGRASRPDESRAERGTSRSAHPRAHSEVRSAKHRSSPPARLSPPPKKVHRRSGGEASRR